MGYSQEQQADIQKQEVAPPPPSQWDIHPDTPVGQVLAHARAHYGLSLRDVEIALRIRESQLAALESNRFDLLPGPVYAVGFIRAYAEYLGLDGGKMVYMYKLQSGGSKSRPTVNIPAPASESKVPNLKVLAGAFFALVILIAGMATLSGSNEVVHDISQPPEQAATLDIFESMPLEASVLAAIETAAGDASPAEAIEPDGRILIEVKDEAWVEIRNKDGKALVSKVLEPGTRYLVPDEEGITLDTGNMGGLVLTVDGQELPPLGSTEDVRRNMALDPDSLLTAR